MEFVEVDDDYGFIRDSVWLRDWLVKTKIHGYHSISYIVDPDLPVPFSYTVHDLIRIKYPDFSYTDEDFINKFGTEEFCRMQEVLQTFLGSKATPVICQNDRGVFFNYFLAINQYLKEKSRHVVTGSFSVKQDLIDILSVPISKICVISSAIDPFTFFPKSQPHISQVLLSYDIPQAYCLYVGTGHKHKRLNWLIEILSKYINDIPANSRLVLVGSHFDLNPRLRETITSYNLDRFIVFTGRVSDEELSCLYSGAKALVISSVDEGFCIPVLEALGCGTEVIVPDREIFHEVVGDHGHFYDAIYGDKLPELILKAFNNTLPSKGNAFINRFCWRRSASKLLRLMIRQQRNSVENLELKESFSEDISG